MIAAACALLIAPVSADSAAALLGLSPPVEVRSAGGFLDGGSFGVNFIDVCGGTSPTEGEPARTDEPTLGAVDFRRLPDIAAWLQVWSPGDTLTVSQFAFDSSRPLTSGPHWILADSGVVYAEFTPEEARNWVLSPDSSRAVRFLPDVDSEGYPITEPDTGVALCEFGPGRKRIILYCGTLCDFEVAAWLDATTVLIGGGDWEDFRPVLYRVDVLRGTVALFVGPRRDGGRRTEVERDVQRLWEGRYPWIRWGDAPE